MEGSLRGAVLLPGWDLTGGEVQPSKHYSRPGGVSVGGEHLWVLGVNPVKEDLPPCTGGCLGSGSPGQAGGCQTQSHLGGPETLPAPGREPKKQRRKAMGVVEARQGRRLARGFCMPLQGRGLGGGNPKTWWVEGGWLRNCTSFHGLHHHVHTSTWPGG